MKKLNYIKINKFIAENVMNSFYSKRTEKVKSAKLLQIISRKNPYLFKAKNIETAGELAENILNAFLSSQEETIFGDLMEQLAIFICNETFGGKKAKQGEYPSVDLIFERNKDVYVVGIKSGTHWGNSDQLAMMRNNFKKIEKQIKIQYPGKNIIFVNGCIYGKDNRPHKKSKDKKRQSYYKICGQEFWELVSGDNLLYKKIIQPLDKEAKKKSNVFKKLYSQKINEMTEDIINNFCIKHMLDWDKILDYVSKK